MRHVVVHEQGIRVLQRLCLAKVDPLGLVIALPVQSSRLLDTTQTLMVSGDTALLRHLERDLNKDPVVEAIPSLGTQQETRVENGDASGVCDFRLGLDRSVSLEVEGLCEVRSVRLPPGPKGRRRWPSNNS